MIRAEDVFTALYQSFHKLERINPDDSPEQVLAAQKEVEKELKEGAQLLERYINMRIKKAIKKMKNDGELK